MMEEFRLLLDSYLKGAISQPEMKRLAQLMELPEHQLEMAGIIDENFERKEINEIFPEPESEAIYERILLAISPVEVGKVVPLKKRVARAKWIAAAAILLVVSGLWFVVERKATRQQDKEETNVAQKTDVPAPAKTRAEIILADGRKVYLDSAGKGVLAQQNNVDVIKNENGEVSYRLQDGGDREGKLVYNTLNNPRGSKVFDMALSDGSHVWLNAGSSLKYPVVFIGKERKVEITGEAYFEVAHDASKPFHVVKGANDITVLGTHFNVNAYDDEEALKVTLLEGSVRVSASGGAAIIKPGEQARVTRNSKPQVRNSVDLDEVMAWKNGKFAFGESTGLKEIMRQVSRWYDVEVIFRDDVQQEFGGSMSRQSNISQVLEKLELTRKVHFTTEGKKVIVSK